MMGVLEALAVWLGLAGGVWGIFALMDPLIKPEVRKDLAQRLFTLNTVNEGVLKLAPKLLDGVFGKDHLSNRCFLCSYFLSVLFFALITFVLLSVWYPEFSDDFTRFIFFGVIINCFADYVSLLETRVLLKNTSNMFSKKSIFFLLCDFVLTILIFTVFGSGALFAYLIYSGQEITIIAALKYMWDVLIFPYTFFASKEDMTFQDILVLSAYLTTFSTSVWYWLYIISALIILAWKRLKTISEWMQRNIYELEQKPLTVLGAIAALFISALFWVAKLIQWLIESPATVQP
jgi:hypothetical protein